VVAQKEYKVAPIINILMPLFSHETNMPLEIILKEAAQKMNENLVRYEYLMA
jgi:hypothetical protein